MSYGKVHDVFWDDDKIEKISDRAALLALFLVSGRHRNAIGCFRLGIGAITDNPRFGGWGIDGVSIALRELSDMGFIVRDDRTGWTFITNALKHDPIIGRKAAVHAAKLAAVVPANLYVFQILRTKLEPQLEAVLGDEIEVTGYPMKGQSMGVTTPIDTLSKGYRSPEPLPEPEPEPQPEPQPAAAGGEPVGSWRGLGMSEPDPLKPIHIQVIQAFDRERVLAFGEGQARAHPLAEDVAHAQRFLSSGADLDLCRGVFAAVCGRHAGVGKPPPSGLQYFPKPIADALAAKRAPMPAGTATPSKKFDAVAYLAAKEAAQ